MVRGMGMVGEVIAETSIVAAAVTRIGWMRIT